MTSVLPPRAARVAFWIFVGTLAFQLGVLIRFSRSPHFLPSSDDMKFYHDWALRILAGKWTDHQAFYGLPGYAFCLAGIYTIVGVDPFVVGALQAVFFAATGAVIFLLSHGAFSAGEEEESKDFITQWRPTLIGLLASLGWALFVPAQTFAVILMPTVWLVLAYWGCVLWLSRVRSARLWQWLAFGVIVGITAMLVATILFVLPIALFVIARTVARTAKPARRAVGALAATALLFSGVFLGASPAWIHNYFIAREPVLLSAHSGLNLWIGNNPVANGYPKIPPGLRASQEGLLRDSITLAQAATGRDLKKYEVSRYWSERANEWIREHRIAWLRLMFVKFENFWNAFQYDDLSTIELLETAGVLWPGLRFGIVSAIGLVGLGLATYRAPRARFVCAAVLLHMAAMMPVFVTERYRLAAVPGLLIGAAYGLYVLWEWVTARRWKAISGWLVAAAVTVTFASVPRGDPGLWSLDHYKAGIRSLDLNELPRAKSELEIAYRYASTNAEINFALGNYWLSAGDPARAKLFYRHTLDLDEHHAGAFNNLGVIMLEEKRWDWAQKFLLRAIAIEPEDAKAHYLLARAYAGAGKLNDAREALDAAQRLKPHQKEFSSLASELDANPSAK